MFKFLFTTAPLLATLVFAAPRPNIQQVAQFYNEEIAPAISHTTVSVTEATATVEPLEVGLSFDTKEIEAVNKALEGLSTKSAFETRFVTKTSASDEPSATAEPSTDVELSSVVEATSDVGPTISLAPSVTLEPAPSDDALSLLGRAQVSASAVDIDGLGELITEVDKTPLTASAPEETPALVSDQNAAFAEGAAALINKVLQDLNLPSSGIIKLGASDGSSLIAEPTTLSTAVGTPLASAIPEASDAPSDADEAISQLGRRNEAPATTLATVVVAATATAGTGALAPDATAIAIPAATDAPAPVATEEPSPSVDTRAIGRRNVLYFTNWGIYGANYQPQQLPADKVTHLLYAFADIASDGTVKSSDSWADVDKRYPTDSWNDVGKNAYGCVKQLYILKKKNRKLKTMLSIGGWTYSYKFPPVAATAAGRKQFATSAVKLMVDWGFDGIDIDWEYPANNAEANNYVLLLKEVRATLDKYSTTNKLNYHFLITVATPAGPSHYNQMNLKGMNPYVDAWHLMAYDYAGSWDTTTGHQSNIWPSKNNPVSTKFSTDKAVTDYLKAGIPANKIVMGLPLYGRSFAGTTGMGKSYSGVGGGAQGIYRFNELPVAGSKAYWDKSAGSIYSWNPNTKEIVTYDNVGSANVKADYLLKKNLGGAVFWEASGDKTGARSLVGILARRMGNLDSTQNNLRYPTSQYDNIRKNSP